MNRSLNARLVPFLRGAALKRGALFGAILVGALLAFEVFNYSTTAFALADMLGDLKFAGFHWSTILALAFCGIDFAGVARIFTPQLGRQEPAEVWYLFGAWLLAAGFNAALTWWGVSIAIIDHSAQGSILIGRNMLIKAVPVFVAIMVWLIRVLIIGTFSIAGENIFTMAEDRPVQRRSVQPGLSPQPQFQMSRKPAPPAIHPAPKPAPVYGAARPNTPPEPAYHPVGMSARPYNENRPQRS